MRPKVCKACGTKFTPVRQFQVVCNTIQCAIDHANNLKSKRERKEHRERKAKAKTLTEWLDDAQSWFNRYIRLRDAGKPCISCGTTANVQYAAGHYRTRKAASHLRFNEDNVFLQCNRNCNCGKSGNTIEMRKGMIERIGVERVEAIENDNRIHRWTVDEAKQIIATYKRKVKEISSTLLTVG